MNSLLRAYRLRFLIFILIGLVTGIKSYSQTEDFGLWTGIEVEKKISKRFDWSIELANRMQDNLNQRDKTYIGTEISYSKKIFSTSFLYRLSNEKKKKYEPTSHRFTWEIEVAPKIDRFKLSYRGRLQTQYTGINSSEDGHIPESFFRNRLKLDYNIKGLPFKPSVSYELFYRINQYTTRQIEKNRYIVGLDYKINKSNSVGLSFLINETVNVVEPVKRYIMGIDYKLKL